MTYESKISSTRPLDVLVVGGGIAGFATALGLRKNGHNVTIFEQRDSTSELGAGVVMTPNAHGIIKRLGIDAEKDGAIARQWHTEYTYFGKLLRRADVRRTDGMWQHTGILCRRFDIHNALQSAAVAAEGIGPPVILRTSSRVTKTVPESATVVFEDHSTASGDLLIGADGIKSATRNQLHDLRPFPYGKSVYRFLLCRDQALRNPDLGDIIQREGEFSIWYGTDRRVWLYSIHFNRTLNVVCLFPDSLIGDSSINTRDALRDQEQADQNKARMLEIFKDFDPRVIALLNMAEASSARLWRLYDLQHPPTRQKGRLGLVGDAALPFLPHLGQGTACALEDAACMATLFGSDVLVNDIPERLKLYERCRKSRAEKINSFSSSLGYDLDPGTEDTQLTQKLMATNNFLPYIFDHDEFDHSAQKLREYECAKAPALCIMPTSFGPLPKLERMLPRQSLHGETHIASTMKFKTSKTQLRNLLPKPELTFTSMGSIALASFTHTHHSNVSWLAGQSYSELAFHIYSIQYTGQNNSSPSDSAFLVVSFVDSADVLIRGRASSGIPMVFCNFEIQNLGNKREIKALWNDRVICRMKFATEGEFTNQESITNHTVLTHRYLPSVDIGAKPLVDSIISLKRQPSNPGNTAKFKKSVDSLLSVFAHCPEELPTLHHILKPLASLPILEIVESHIIEQSGGPVIEEAREL